MAPCAFVLCVRAQDRLQKKEEEEEEEAGAREQKKNARAPSLAAKPKQKPRDRLDPLETNINTTTHTLLP